MSKMIFDSLLSFHFEIDVGANFPIRYRGWGYLPNAVALTIFSLVFMSLGLYLIYYHYHLEMIAGQAGLIDDTWKRVGLLLSGLSLFILIMITLLVYRLNLAIDEASVLFDKKTLWKKVLWRESLASFKTVLMEEYLHQVKNGAYTEHKISLIHKGQSKKNLVLFNSRKNGSALFRQRGEAYSKYFKLPVTLKNDPDEDIKS